MFVCISVATVTASVKDFNCYSSYYAILLRPHISINMDVSLLIQTFWWYLRVKLFTDIYIHRCIAETVYVSCNFWNYVPQNLSEFSVNKSQLVVFIHEKQEAVKHCDTWQKQFILSLTPQKCSNLHTYPQQKGFMHHFPHHTFITPSNQLTILQCH